MADYNGKHSGQEIDTAIFEMGTAADYDSTHTYSKYDYCTHTDENNERKLWRCKNSNVTGAWNSVNWKKTSCIEELREILGDFNGTERVTIEVGVNKGEGVVAGKTVVVHFAAGSSMSDTTLTLNASGKATIDIPYGDVYRIEPSALADYMILPTSYFSASLPARVIGMRYVLADGYYIIKNNGDLIPSGEWVSGEHSAADAWGSMYTDDNMSACPIVFPKTFTVGSAIFQPEYVDCTAVTNRTNVNAAKADYLGKAENEQWVTWAETAVEGETPIQKYNRTQSKNVDINGYLPAIRTCYNKTVSYGGATLHGYLPSMGQLFFMMDNWDGFNNLQTVIGGTAFPNLSSGNWWSCSEYLNYDCWILYGGTVTNGTKVGSFQLFALYDLSEINL